MQKIVLQNHGPSKACCVARYHLLRPFNQACAKAVDLAPPNRALQDCCNRAAPILEEHRTGGRLAAQDGVKCQSSCHGAFKIHLTHAFLASTTDPPTGAQSCKSIAGSLCRSRQAQIEHAAARQPASKPLTFAAVGVSNASPISSSLGGVTTTADDSDSSGTLNRVGFPRYAIQRKRVFLRASNVVRAASSIAIRRR